MLPKFQIIESLENQTTLESPFLLGGYSLLSGKHCEITFKPAEAGTGIIFKKGDTFIPANYKFMMEDEVGNTTSLRFGETTIKTIEHIMSALYGMEIDNAVLEMSNGDIPFLDASSIHYVNAIKSCKTQYLPQTRRYIEVLKTNVIKSEVSEEDRTAVFSPSEKLFVDTKISFNNIIGSQKYYGTISKENYENNICWARSFLSSSLDKDPEFYERVRQKLRFLPENPEHSPVITYNDRTFITPLKAVDEPVRHKVLDFIGDIALLGIRIKGNVILEKPGHRFTRHIVKNIASELISIYGEDFLVI